MCGIAGFSSLRMHPPQVLASMVESLLERGPDSAGYFRSPKYCAGMRRLSINDLSSGDQPLYNEDRSVVLFYNGEIYNSPQLRKDLEARGHTFSTRSDGEVICHLYEELGEGLFEKLDGMFAAALWIAKEEKLILARDIPGEKPLYYMTPSPKELVFASQIRSLALFPGADLTIDPQAVWDLPTFLWVPEPATIFRNIRALPRGHILVFDGQGTRVKAFENHFHSRPLGNSEEEIIAETRRTVTEAVQSRLLSDVPIGSFLSSGLDSSIVSSIAARSVGKLTTFTVGFEDIEDPYHGRADESSLATAFAKQLGTAHHTIRVTGNDFRNALDKFVVHGDQPWSVSSGLGILAVAKVARENGIKVVLSGDGADECFGGYSWYNYLPLLSGCQLAASRTDADVSFQDIGLEPEERARTLSRLSAQKQAWGLHYYASEAEKTMIFSRDITSSAQSSLRHFREFNTADRWHPEDFIRHDREFYFPNEMLRKVDRMMMAYSVEGRVPFAAPAVLSLANKLRYSHLVKNGTLKWVLRKAFEDMLPPDVISRQKHGFNVPIDHWLRSEWRDLVSETFASGSQLVRSGLVAQGTGDLVQRLLDQPNRLNGHTIFSFVTLNLWMEKTRGWKSLPR